MQFIDEEIFLLAPTDYRVMPWKNGGGTTREILAYPSDTENFDWRLSIADIQADGAFSPFPGYARTIMLLEGNGMRLEIGDAPAVTVQEKFRPLDFDGSSETHCTLTGGPIRDFNIMSSRDRVSHNHHVIEHFPWPLNGPSKVDRATSAVAIFALHGEISVRATRAATITVPESCTLLISSPSRLRQLDGAQNAKALLVGVKHKHQAHGHKYP